MADYNVKIEENEKRDKYLDFARDINKTMEHEGDCDTNCNWYTWNDHYGLVWGLEKLEIGGRAETIEITALLRSARILSGVLKTWVDLLSLEFH